MGRILAIDYGTVRIGLALSDPDRILARGLPTQSIAKTKDIFAHVLNILTEFEVEKIIIGLPLNEDGTASPTTDRVSRFCQELKNHTPKEVVLWDETYSTLEALKRMHHLPKKKRRDKNLKDQFTAIGILQSYLDEQQRPLNQS